MSGLLLVSTKAITRFTRDMDQSTLNPLVKTATAHVPTHVARQYQPVICVIDVKITRCTIGAKGFNLLQERVDKKD